MDSELSSSIAEIKEKLGLDLSQIAESYKVANSLVSQIGKDPISRWDLMAELLMNDELTRSQVIFAAWLTGQILAELGCETRISG